MPYWRYWYIVENLTDLLKKKQESEGNAQGSEDKYNVDDMQANAQKQMSKYTKGPKLPSMSMPKFPSMPSIKL